MKRLAITSIYAAMSIFLFAACNNDNNDVINNGTQNPEADVYIAGNNGETAVLWKNGQATTFPYLGALDVAVSGNEVYLLGLRYEGTNTSPFYYYWKKEQPETPTSLGGGGNAISVSGSDVYVGGGSELFNRSPINPCYWKNGQEIDLPNAAGLGTVTDIAVSGNGDVYMAGLYYGPNGVAVYWKNEELVVLGSVDPGGKVAIAVSGNDVYVCGTVVDDSGQREAVYWKNGQMVELAQNAYTTGIAVSGNDVYVCGSSSDEAVYWKNGKQITLEQNNVPTTGIAVHGNDVYVCGYTGSNSPGTYDPNKYTAVYWKNGEKVELGTGMAYAIVVK